jgi:cytoskeletal protein CcmA (bactofilin family)
MEPNTPPSTPAADSQPPAAASAPPPEPNDAEDALETAEPETDTAGATATGSSLPPPKKSGGIKALLKRFNIYLLMFLFVLITAAMIIVVSYLQSSKSTVATIKSQSLSGSALQQIASSDATVGSSSQLLNVQSNAVFAGSVLVRNALQIAGNLTVGGTLSLTNIDVSGTSSLAQLTVSKNLAVTGDSALQGALTVGKSLVVNGSGTFNGPITAPTISAASLNLSSDLVLTHHITAGGPSPSRTNGTALGAGGSATVGGSDTSGTVSINTGSTPLAGCFITVYFATRFNSTPHVLVTPIGSAAGGLAYYVERSSSSFSVCDASSPPAGSSFAFDYFILD